MGPLATQHFFGKLIEFCQKKYGAVQDTDYPKIIIYNNPLTGFDETGVVDCSLVKKQLISGAKLLENGGADFIVMPCNTVHLFSKEIRKNISIPLVSIIEETCKRVITGEKVGLLASETTVKEKLYENELARAGITAIVPTAGAQKELTKIILKVMAGKHGQKDSEAILRIAKALFEKGASRVMIACTELSLVMPKHGGLTDSLSVLAESAINRAVIGKNNKNPITHTSAPQ